MVFVRLLTLHVVLCVLHSATSGSRHVLPVLYELDDWGRCDIAPERDWYCMVRVIVDGQHPSLRFENDDRKHFRRTLLDRGVCLTPEARAGDDASTGRLEAPPKRWNKSDRYIMSEFFPSSMQAELATELAVGDVINRRLSSRSPGLTAYTEIEYCLKHDPQGQFEFALGVSVAVAFALAIALVLNARSWIAGEFASAREPSGGKQFLLFDLYKSFGLVGVVLAHSTLFGPFLMPIANVELLEQVIAHPSAKLWRLVCPFLMLVFFAMSAMLLTVKLLHASGTPCPRPTFAAIVTNRLIRLMPLNLLTLAFGALVYDRFIGGPLAPRQLSVEQGFCRSRWWMNVLFISNFNMNQPCLPHSWYISADFQLFLLITLVLMAMMSAFMAQLYTPFYNNLCWSVGGMLAGIVYNRFQRSNSLTRDRLLHGINYGIGIFLAMLVVSIHETMSASDESSPNARWPLAAWYSTYKLSAAAFFSASMLRILLTEKDFYGSSIVRMGAKLYYCVYLIHLPIFRIVFSNETAVVEGTLPLLKYSKFASYHEHSLLDRGLCVDACVGLVDRLDPAVAATFYTERTTVTPYRLLSIPSEKDLPEQQARYGRVLNICANYHLQQRYNLSGYSELERCVAADSRLPVLDIYHVLFALVVVILLGAVGFATYCDGQKVAPTNNNNYSPHRNGALWMEFSLKRTCSQLIAVPRSPIQRDFAFVEIFRMLSVFVILAIHVTMCYIAAPTANMRPLEEFFGRRFSLMAVSVFPFQVHTFFTIGGVMLAVHFLDQAASRAANRPIGWSFLWKGLVMRYARIFPVLFVVWLYQVSWLDWYASGPGDYRYFGLEKDNCRTNGWLNFLLINNYFKYGNMCMQQTWHLAADFQFFLVGLTFLILIVRHPRMLWPLVVAATVFSVVAPVINLYRHKLPGVILTNFKQFRFILYAHPTLENDYMLSHPHTCSYFSGLFAGIAYHRSRTSPIPLLSGGNVVWMLKWVPPTLVLLQAAPAPFFYGLNYSQPMLWNAIYGAVHRCCWGAMCAVGILYGATLWNGRRARIHFHPALLVLSRLSFGVYIVQFNVLKSLTQNATDEGVDFNWQIYVRMTSASPSV
uniref:Acyltransferase 3 domain-containing protein n=1 Tax=Anopheles farauti TaxID=69004 RepID=A0A182Q9U0_9DIPT